MFHDHHGNGTEPRCAPADGNKNEELIQCSLRENTLSSKNIRTRPKLLCENHFGAAEGSVPCSGTADHHYNSTDGSHLLCRSYLSVVVDLRFLLNVGVEFWDVRHVAV